MSEWQTAFSNRKQKRKEEYKRKKEAPDYEDIINLLESNGIVYSGEINFIFRPFPGTEIRLKGINKYSIYQNNVLITDNYHPGKIIR